MKLALMQPYFFPYIGYFQLINAADKFISFDTVNYIKRGWIKRNRYLLNNAVRYFTLSIQNASQNKLIIETYISDEEELHSKENIVKSLHQAYSKAPNFEKVFPFIEKLILNNEQNISLYNTQILRELCHYLNIDTEILLGSKVLEKSNLQGQERVIEICQEFNAKCYINPIGGRELYNTKEFANHNIRLLFLRPKDTIIYHQQGNTFFPNLSIIDVLMYNTRDKIADFLNQYALIEETL